MDLLEMDLPGDICPIWQICIYTVKSELRIIHNFVL